jgi:hypothetical protein
MKRILQLSALLFLFVGCFANAQNIVWTGNSSNNDFFDEGNWKNSITNVSPSSGSIDPDVAINLPLQIGNAGAKIIALGGINMGSGSLAVSNAEIKAPSIYGAGGNVTINEGTYLEFTDAIPFKASGSRVTLNFTSGLAWIRTPNYSPRIILITNMAQIKVNSATASYKNNLRLDNYYMGCVIRPNLLTTAPLTIYDGQNLQGKSAALTVDAIHSGNAIAGEMNNKMQSFVLKKGYMVTMADVADGTGKSKNYIASESDLTIQILPKVLQKSISFIRVMPWNWVSKKGFNAPVDANLNSGWRYQWNHNESSNISYEFAPMSWGQGTATDAWIVQHLKLYNTTHMMSFNEPDDCDAQSGQYGNPKLCVVEEAVKWHKNLAKTGMRLVSPGGREEAPFGWLKEFHQKATAQDVRIDAIAVHWYDWGSNPGANPNPTALQVFNRFKAYLTNVHNLYGLPIWITEFNANPARSQAINAGFLQLALPYLESLDYIERYCWFPFNTGTHFTGWDDTTNKPTGTDLSLVGTIYKNINNTTPTASTPSIPEAIVDQNNNLNLVQFPNIVLNKPATANSSFSTSFLPEKAVDGDTASSTSLWVANIGNVSGANLTPLPAWIEVDLQGSFKIDSFRIFETSNALKDFNFQVWDATLNSGAGGWSNALTVTGNPASPLTTYKTINNVITTKVRLFITAHNSTTLIRMFEFEVYGTVVETLSVKKHEKQAFTVYPNPVKNGILNISGAEEVKSVDVYNILGSKIEIPYENGSLQVNNLAAGTYFLRINNTHSFKFIKE